MLTRIEIDGFKTFRDFVLDVPPFLVILGQNATGKSNLFDALLFLGQLVDTSLLQAARRTRGDVVDLFHRRLDGGRAERMSFAVEVLLERSVTDAFGDTSPVRHSRVRYELGIELRNTPQGERPFVHHESVRLIRRAEDRWLDRFPVSARKWIAAYSTRSLPDLLTTDADESGRLRFRLYQERRQGRPRELPANEATATVLSSLTTANEFTLLYALKRELQSWRLLHLDPTALRKPDSFDDPDTIAPNGAHLANSLRRLMQETGTGDRPDGVLNDLAADLAAVIPEVIEIGLQEDPGRRQRQVQVVNRQEAPFSAQVASDGTLRAIALLAALYDPRGAGLVCFEEPENGIYPDRLARFVRHLRALVLRPLELRGQGADNRLTQLILSSHSPTILKSLREVDDVGALTDVVFIDLLTRKSSDRTRSRVSRVRKVLTAFQPALDYEIGTVVSPAEIAEFEVQESLGR